MGLLLSGYLWLQRCKYFTVEGLEISVFLWYNGYSKNPPRLERDALLRWDEWYAIWGLTTVLTIYRFGLRGNYGLCGTQKHVFRTKKHRKALKMRQKTVIAFFGTSMPQVRTLSLRPAWVFVRTLTFFVYYGCPDLFSLKFISKLIFPLQNLKGWRLFFVSPFLTLFNLNLPNTFYIKYSFCKSRLYSFRICTWMGWE